MRCDPRTPHRLVPGTLCWTGMDLEARLTELYNDLGEMQGELGLSLKQARDRGELMGFNFSGHTASSAESLRTVVGQLRTVVRGN